MIQLKSMQGYWRGGGEGVLQCAFDKLSGNGNFTLGIFNENVAKLWVDFDMGRERERESGLCSKLSVEAGQGWGDFDVTLWLRFDMTNMCIGMHDKHTRERRKQRTEHYHHYQRQRLQEKEEEQQQEEQHYGQYGEHYDDHYARTIARLCST